MDTITLVEPQVDDGRAYLEKLARERFPVVVACWVKPTEEDRWSLYIATPFVDQKGAAGAYREAYRILRSLGPLSFTDSDVKLIGTEHPVATDVGSILQKYPAMAPIRSRRPLLGGIPVDETYIYPPQRPRDARCDVGLRKLKSAVQQRMQPADFTTPYSPDEQHAVDQLHASGMTSEEARYWIWKRREQERGLRFIPEGAVVKANYTAWWGDKPEDDPNPLLLIEAGDGAQGLTFLNDTEPA